MLLINACARPQSRTLALAKEALQKVAGTYETVNIYEENVKPLGYEDLLMREEAIKNADFSGEMFRFAAQFGKADELMIATPYWDLSFPSALKCYLEAICVNGLTFRYTEAGIPEGLCRAKRLIYVTTAGGYIPEHNFGYDYVKQLCTDFFGIGNTVYIKAEGLDIWGADIDGIMNAAKADIEKKLKR